MWKIFISLCVGLIVLFAIARDEIPGPSAWYAYLYELSAPLVIGKLGGTADVVHLPKPQLTVKQRADAILAELHAKPDMELRAISIAEKPCASGLMDCRGLAERFVKNAALAEVTQRAKDKENEIAIRNAESNQRNAETAGRNLWLVGMGSAIAAGSLVFAALLGPPAATKIGGGDGGTS